MNSKDPPAISVAGLFFACEHDKIVKFGRYNGKYLPNPLTKILLVSIIKA